MAKTDRLLMRQLSRLGIAGLENKKIFRNLPRDSWVKIAVERREVTKSKNGAVVVYTGKYTGRSPKDKFIVNAGSVQNKINWGNVNIPFDQSKYEKIYNKVINYVSNLPDIFIFDGVAGADKKFCLPVRVISEYAYQTLFANNLFREIGKFETDKFKPQLTIISVPNFLADPANDGTNSEAFIILNLDKMIILLGGTKYSGEIKKSVFSVLNYILPLRGVLPMHCSANVGARGDSALFFGLSGTGKTTLSTDLGRFLIGDDEHGWSDRGIFNFEGGCYAKCINLKKENEPQIWQAIKKGALLENVTFKKDGDFDFNDSSLTENTRAAYPLNFIEKMSSKGVAGHPGKIIFLMADAFGVLPPVAKLSDKAAVYHFLSGYTSKVAGTERDIKEPKATFSECFGAPFMPLPPVRYAKLLRNFIKKYKSEAYLVNTGWQGGSYGAGKRIKIKDTRAIVSAILKNKINKVEYRRDKVFNLDVPVSVPGIKESILNPRDLWPDKKTYDKKAIELASLFEENFKKFKGIPKEIRNAGPRSKF